MLLCNLLKCLEVNQVHHTSHIDRPENHLDLQCGMPVSNCLSYINTTCFATFASFKHLHGISIYCSFIFLKHTTLCGLSVNQTSPICLSSHLHLVHSVPGHLPFHTGNLLWDSVFTHSYNMSMTIVFYYLLILYGNYLESLSVFLFSFHSGYVSCVFYMSCFWSVY